VADKDEAKVTSDLSREEILPEADLPHSATLIERGRDRARAVPLGRSAFLETYGVPSEAAYKRRQADAGRLMLHAQIGYRDVGKSRRAWREIHDQVGSVGGRLDRYGICLDWSMGYPAEERHGRPKGTGLILPDEESWAALTSEAPVAPHFGDFVLGMPAAVENAAAALRAGSTTIGNIGQYFTFRLPGREDDLEPTAATVEALAMLSASPAEILVHSNLDDGFAALFCDLATAFGAVLIERHIVEDLLGCRLGHCYGHSFSNPVTRLAFQRALARAPGALGTMIYGNTVAYRGAGPENYAALARYLSVDALGQLIAPTGHALNPVPVTEAERIPDIDEVVAALKFAIRLFENIEETRALVSTEEADVLAERIVTGGQIFRDSLFDGLTQAGIDVTDPFELLLALRRIGPKRLEELYGPGTADGREPRGRRPMVKASTIAELEARAEAVIRNLTPETRARIAAARLNICFGSSDVHEYGKMLAETICRRMDADIMDAGVHAEPTAFAQMAIRGNADLIVVGTYNGIALDYLLSLKRSLTQRGARIPVVVGGRLNQLPETSNSSLPRDVTEDIKTAGGIPCADMESFVVRLSEIAMEKHA
jgi:methylmalonyl-CoA mutase cobalamin-binding subunit